MIQFLTKSTDTPIGRPRYSTPSYSTLSGQDSLPCESNPINQSFCISDNVLLPGQFTVLAKPSWLSWSATFPRSLWYKFWCFSFSMQRQGTRSCSAPSSFPSRSVSVLSHPIYMGLNKPPVYINSLFASWVPSRWLFSLWIFTSLMKVWTGGPRFNEAASQAIMARLKALGRRDCEYPACVQIPLVTIWVNWSFRPR